jgi:FkbM family methyltransferase
MKRVLTSTSLLAATCLGGAVLSCTSTDNDFAVNLRPTVRNRNDLDTSQVAPRLLHDGPEMTAYMLGLPAGAYRVHLVRGVGRFYLDEGDDVIKGNLRVGIRWEGSIDRLLARHTKPGTTAIDAGAHIGTHTLELARRVGVDGRVYAFEPQKKLFRELVFNLRLNQAMNVVPLRFALGDSSEIIEMSPPVARNEGGTGVGLGGDRAELRKIDSFEFQNVSIMKIDVEGYEDHVLRGARETIKRWKPVLLVEIQGGQNYDKTTPEVRAKIDATKSIIESFGYKVERVSEHDYLGLPL